MGDRRQLPWVFVPAIVFVLAGLFVMHGIDGSHATPDMSIDSPAPAAAVGTVGPADSSDPAPTSGRGIVPVWSSGTDRTVGHAGDPGAGEGLRDVAMACIAVLLTVAASVGVRAALTRARSRVAERSVAIHRVAQTVWRPPAPATHERGVLIC